LDELRLRWEELRDQGAPVSPEELCADCPELLTELKRQVHELQALEPLLRACKSQTAPWPANAPQTVGGYAVLGVLGEGGMGVVFKARKGDGLPLVAVKMILAGAHAGPQQLARFRVEAEAVSRLRHPNIVQVLEVGEHDGRPWLALEFVDSGSLAEKLNGTPLLPRRAAELAEV
jgi:serine/threonine-protein kinase